MMLTFFIFRKIKIIIPTTESGKRSPRITEKNTIEMMINPETGEEEQELRYFIGYPGGASNINSIKVTVTEEMIKTPVQLAREVDWSQLIAL